uniref:Uncharacterized protein n=1 Tax=Rhizophora mucronata TaxID=61149 RepID=A0A2P2NV05_RHIMU
MNWKFKSRYPKIVGSRDRGGICLRASGNCGLAENCGLEIMLF